MHLHSKAPDCLRFVCMWECIAMHTWACVPCVCLLCMMVLTRSETTQALEWELMGMGGPWPSIPKPQSLPRKSPSRLLAPPFGLLKVLLPIILLLLLDHLLLFHIFCFYSCQERIEIITWGGGGRRGGCSYGPGAIGASPGLIGFIPPSVTACIFIPLVSIQCVLLLITEVSEMWTWMEKLSMEKNDQHRVCGVFGVARFTCDCDTYVINVLYSTDFLEQWLLKCSE